MRLITRLFCVAICATGGFISGCGSPSEFPITAGKYTILGILTDNKDHTQAKANAQQTLTKHPDIAGMVGLWAYNPPMILSALKGAGKEGKVAVIAFDEDKDTLEGIADGHIYGTVVQQPFVFGYKSVEYLAALARGQAVDIPETGILTVPVTIVTKDNAKRFSDETDLKRTGRGTPPKHDREYDLSNRVRVAFITNSVDPFWQLAEEGCKLAEKSLNAECRFLAPPNGTVEEQKRMIEERIADKCQGLAVSPIDPENEQEIIDKACAAMHVICQDSDAPKSKRKFYLGTSNYLAGREAGKMIKLALPDGGKIMIFVGKMEVLNAQERSRGVIDELQDKPIPEEYQKHKSL